MYTRLYSKPTTSFFLFGPRGTGKTTWLKQQFKAAYWINLLQSDRFLTLNQNPALFRKEIEAEVKEGWVIIDEVQKVPELLDEVHFLMNEYGKRLRFALTGSSARKLKRSGINLLAGRAIQRKFFPLTGAEMQFDFDVGDLVQYGALPEVCDQSNREPQKRDFLLSYVDTYLRQEVLQEAVVKNLPAFTRFLQVAAIMNGQVLNVSNIARDAEVSRTTAHGYFEILADTLVGFLLPAWQPALKVKEIAHPKFYFFDPGVVQALAGRLNQSLDDRHAEFGFLLETVVLNELRTAVEQQGVIGAISYWSSKAVEVDFVIGSGKKAVAIEVKSSKRWRPEFGRGLAELIESKKVQKAFGVYLGEQKLKEKFGIVLPLKTFMKDLSAGKILDILHQ